MVRGAHAAQRGSAVSGMSETERLDFSALRWRWCRFDELSVFELQAIYMARQQVFAIEQQCAYLDADGYDEASFHIAAWSHPHRVPLAYARVVHPGQKYAEPSIGRVLTTEAARGAGLGRELVRRAVEGCVKAFPGQGIRISAQSHLERFYAAFGFVAAGAPYLEDGIPHTEMLRRG
jgi:ElaA protein